MSLLRFTKDHEWIRLDGDIAVVGITDFAQSQLGDVVYVELPEIGRQVEQGKEAAVVESVKAASEVYAPVSGEVVEVNETLTADPAKVNADAMGEGWFLKLRLADPKQLDGLLDEDAYKKFVEELVGRGVPAEAWDLRSARPLPASEYVIMQASLYHFLPDARRMLEAIEDLPEDEREVFDLVRIQGMSPTEVAALLDVSARTVERRLSRSLIALTEALADLH